MLYKINSPGFCIKSALRLCQRQTSIVGSRLVHSVNSLVMKEEGSWEQIEATRWPIPMLCGLNEVKVSVDYCGINFADVYHVQGILSQRKPPFVFGLECVGSVIQIGKGVNIFEEGDRVACYVPEGGLCREQVLVPESHCFHIPPAIPSTDAVAMLANYLTAYFGLFRSATLHSGFSLFVHSIAGGVGWAATQLALTVPGVSVYGTCSAHKHKAVIGNGVKVPLTYDNYKEAGHKFDVIIDSIGGDSIKHSLELLKPLGRLVITGASCVVSDDKEEVTAALRSLSSGLELHPLVCGNKGVSGLHLGTLFAESPNIVQQAVKYIFQLHQEGKVMPRIDSIWEFQEGREAIKLLAERKNIGKVLLKIKKN